MHIASSAPLYVLALTAALDTELRCVNDPSRYVNSKGFQNLFWMRPGRYVRKIALICNSSVLIFGTKCHTMCSSDTDGQAGPRRVALGSKRLRWEHLFKPYNLISSNSK